jgi:anthranilate synthase
MRTRFVAPCGIVIERRATELNYANVLEGFAARLDCARGALFSSGIDYPGRYSRWEFGFIEPPLELVGSARLLTLRALNPRGVKLLSIFAPLVTSAPAVRIAARSERELAIAIDTPAAEFAEEDRSLQPTVFTPLRHLIAGFRGIEDRFIGLYGAFGYDLLFQFEPIKLKHARTPDARDLHLFLPDELIVVDRRREVAQRFDYDFALGETSTAGASRRAFTLVQPDPAPKPGPAVSDQTSDQYAARVDAARERMRVGDIFEVVLSRTFSAPWPGTPARLFQRMKRANPSPYEFFIQFGPDQLVGASPEMFVRVEGDRVESCPISGTARRGGDAMEDHARLRALINSEKDEVELTMCTDVDRNDKARICRPGSVRLLARRQIEAYTGLYHTVDHVEGRLREGLVGLDAFLSHMWAVTLTGAPKKMATQIIEDTEPGPRFWYGGAVGGLMLSGDVNTGITIRTVHLAQGTAHYRVGSTLVWDSVGAEEHEETLIKATALFRVLGDQTRKPAVVTRRAPGTGRRIVLVDNEDSFVHTLADYFRQTGAEVTVRRHGLGIERLLALKPDLVVHSPGPARPADFGVPSLVRELAAHGVPQFGVCLGLQGIVEAFGGALDVMAEPRHGKTWTITHDASGIFAGLPSPAAVGAYHSLTARLDRFPDGELAVTARTEGGLVMAVQHRTLPIAAVQFHPESILSASGQWGIRLVENVVEALTSGAKRLAAAE